MNTVFKTILNFLKSIRLRDFVYGLIIILLIGALSTSVSRCSDLRKEYENNIIALNDTIHYYQGKNGNLVATIRGFESDIKTLKLLNIKLYNRIDDLKAKGNVTNATYFTGVIENPEQDTAYIVLHDTIANGFKKDFDFSNEYRVLAGNVNYKEDTVNVNIAKDQVLFDYTVAMDDKNNIMIHSDNPYVKFNSITGFQLSQPKTKHWSLNAFGNFGFEPAHCDRFIDVGLSLDYTIKRFTVGPMLFYQQNFLTKQKGFYIGASGSINILKW